MSHDLCLKKQLITYHYSNLCEHRNIFLHHPRTLNWLKMAPPCRLLAYSRVGTAAPCYVRFRPLATSNARSAPSSFVLLRSHPPESGAPLALRPCSISCSTHCAWNSCQVGAQSEDMALAIRTGDRRMAPVTGFGCGVSVWETLLTSSRSRRLQGLW